MKQFVSCRTSDYRCKDCDKIDPTLVILHDGLWRVVAPEDHKILLCLNCIQLRLGRNIALDDLKPCGMTNSVMLGALLYQRAGCPELSFEPDFIEKY